MTTTTRPRTTAELHAAAEIALPDRGYSADPNLSYHRAQWIKRMITADEREAYAIEDRRTIRPRYIAALDAARTATAEVEAILTVAWSNARRAAGILRVDWTPDLLDHSPAAKARRALVYAAARAESARNMLARATALGTPEHELIEAAESGEIEPSYLLATVPDAYGRVTPFAVTVRTERGSFTYRNHDLSSAVKLARAERASGNHADVHVDACG